MEEKHFIAIIAIIVVFIFIVYAVGNIDIPVFNNNENNESQDSIWNSSENVKITSEGDGTHMKGTNNKACWVALKSGDEQIFINSQNDFTIEMDAKIDNLLALYLPTSQKSNGDINILPVKSNDFQHHMFNYSASDHNLTYSVNGNVVKTMECHFEGKEVGFKMVDWQGDMDAVVKNVFIVSN